MSPSELPAKPHRPFVLIVSGQSNIGFDTGTSKAIGSNILISDNLTNPTSFVPAQFGRAPLNLGVKDGTLPLAWTTEAEEAFDNLGVRFATNLRASGLLPPSRPIVIVPNWFPGQSISQWVADGPGSRLWKCLLRHIEVLARSYPDCWIDHAIWAQGESDSDVAKSAYNTQATYAAGFACLLEQFRRLPQWRPGRTSVTVQELAVWPGSAKFDSRNDVFRSLDQSGQFPEVAMVSSQGMQQSRQTLNPHFDGASLVDLGQRHFDAWRAASGAGADA